MRILVRDSRFHRAFPELDRYSDERGRQFIEAARPGWARRALHGLIILAVSAAVLFGGPAAIGWSIDAWYDPFTREQPLWPAFLVFLVFICAAPVCGYLTRDWLLRRHIRRVLRARLVRHGRARAREVLRPMRLLVLHNRIYRAFPELDKYDDDRCQRFIKAAQRGHIRRVFHWLVILLVSAGFGLGGLLAIGVSLVWLLDEAEPSSLVVVAMFLPLFAAPIVGALTRDWLLRRRIRYIFRARSTCAGCRYSLVGLPVSAAHSVQCPECGLDCEVDPALGELVLDEGGQARFQPTPPRPPRIFTPARVRLLKRTAIVLSLVVGVGLPACWGGYELWLMYQASVARAEKPGADALIALAEANQPAGSEGGANACDLLDQALSIQATTDFADELANPAPAGERLIADFTQIYSDPYANEPPDSAATYATWKANALRRLGAYGPAGLYSTLDAMARAPRALRAISLPPGEPAWNLSPPALSQVRTLARMNLARMKLARDEGDLAGFISAMEANLALARIGAHQVNLMDSLVGAGVESMTYDRLRAFLCFHPSPEWLDAIDAAIVRQKVSVPPAFRWEAERLSSLDTIAWTFGDPERVRWGVRSTFASGLLSEEDSPGRLGTYAENRDTLDSIFRAAAAAASQPRWLRKPVPRATSDLALVKLVAGSVESRMRSNDQLELYRTAYTIASALERYRAAHGDYPASLDALVPTFLAAVPIDPWAGKPFGYRPRPPDASPEDPRGYILYSFGEDGQDNGGRPSPEGNYRALNPKTAAAFDFIINDWRPPD